MSESIEQFKRSLIYNAQAPIEQIQQDVAILRDIDAVQEQLKRKWLIIAIVCLLGIGLCAFNTFPDPARMSGKASQSLSGWGVPTLWAKWGTAAFAVAAIASFAIRYKHGKHDIENRRYELVEQVLRLLKTDSPPDAEANVAIDLRPVDHKSKFTHKGAVGAWKVKYYSDCWLVLGGRLLDGSRYSLDMIEKHQYRSQWKQRGGKSKHKSKTKSAAEAVLKLKVKPERYGAIDFVSEDIRSAVKLPPWAELKAASVSSNLLTLRATTRTEWESAAGAELVALMFLSLYQALNLARELKKS